MLGVEIFYNMVDSVCVCQVRNRKFDTPMEGEFISLGRFQNTKAQWMYDWNHFSHYLVFIGRLFNYNGWSGLYNSSFLSNVEIK